MELNDILALVKAGFTKDEIVAQLTPTVPDPQPVPEPVKETAPVPEPTPAPRPEPVPAPVPASVPEPKQEEPTMSQIMESIAKLTSAVQANAIAQSVIPQGISNPPSAEDMLAEIIRPTFKKE